MSRFDSHTGWALGLAAGALLLLAVRPFFGLVVDDALISFRYAQNWVAGCGPVFSCGEPAVEGYTNFLWVGLAALWLKLGVNVILAMQLCGLAASLLALLVACRLATRLHGHPLAALPVALGLASSPFWALNSVVGLETSAAAASIAGAAYLSLELPRGRPFAAGLAWGLSYLIRPEALVFAGLTGLYLMARGLGLGIKIGTLLRISLRYAGAFLAVAGSYFCWRAVYYQSLFPNTYYAKKGSLKALLPRNLALLGEHTLFWAVLLAAALIALTIAILRRRGGQALYLLTLAGTSAGISLSVHNNWWMPGHRLYLSAALLLCVLAGGLVRWGSRRELWALRGLGPLGLGALLLVMGYSAWADQAGILAAAEQHYARPGHPAESMGQRIRTLAKPGDWLAIRDAGFIPFFAGPKVKVLDMHDHSLNDRHIARQGWDLNYILDHTPRFIVLASTQARSLVLAHSSETRLYRDPRFRPYRQLMTARWHGGRHYFLFTRNEQAASQPGAPASRTPLPAMAKPRFGLRGFGPVQAMKKVVAPKTSGDRANKRPQRKAVRLSKP